jgi:hypothetical protein
MSPDGQELELCGFAREPSGRMPRERMLPLPLLVTGIAQPDVGALAPGYPAKKFSKLRFS